MKQICHLMAALMLLLTFAGCTDKAKQQREKEIQASKVFPIHRFEQILFSAPKEGFKDSLLVTYEDYKHMYNVELSDVDYLSVVYDFAQDTVMRETYHRVVKRYSDLGWLSAALHRGFDTLIRHYPRLQVPKIYSLIVGPNDFSAAYADRVVTTSEFLAFSIDLYAVKQLSDLPYYNHYPRYMQTILDSIYLPVDIFSTYLRQELLSHSDATFFTATSFLEDIIHRGKLLYAVQQCLPDYPEYALLRYTSEQWQWCKENEYAFWGYLLKNKMLYEPDFSKYKTFIQEGGTTNGLEGSPARLGEYLGLKIVQAYAQRNKSSFKEILEIQDYKKLFTEANYKPANHR